MAGRTRQAFLGGNTPQGFYSHFDNLIHPRRTRRLYIIKGGPGTGKSSFMRSVAQRFHEHEYDVEAFHCSSDPESLDAVRIPALEVAWVDGTAPHVIDPKYPGIVDDILDFGEYLDSALLFERRAQIFEIQTEVSHGFQTAYRYLRAAKSVLENIAAANTRAVSHGRLNAKIQSVVSATFGHRAPSDVTGRIRHLFASAITPVGPVHYLPSLMDSVSKRVIVTGEPGVGKSTLLSAVANAAVAHGFDVELFHCPMSPETVDHLIIPKLDVAFITSVEPHTYDDPDATHINLNEFRDYHTVKRNEQMSAEAWELFWQVLHLAVTTLARTKEIRDVLEGYYVEAMDFGPIEALREEQLAQLLNS